MKREQRICDRLYRHLYPRPEPNDPKNFNDHLNQNLVGEVRVETQRFYGGLETVEARYPGLNYTYPPHTKRLSYFPHHARLFQAFKELGLTQSEILSLCRWEGTLWARQRYESDAGVKVEDTTGNEIRQWQPQVRKEVEVEQKVAARRTSRPVSRRSQLPGQRVAQQSVPSNLFRTPLAQVTSQGVPSLARDVQMLDESDVPTPQETAETSAPPTLSPSEALQRMQALAASRANGEMVEAMDPDFEAFLKENAEASTSDSQGTLALEEVPSYQAAQTIATVMNTVAHVNASAYPVGATTGSTTNHHHEPVLSEADIL